MAFNYREIILKEALRPAITYSINDLKNPNNRKGDFSKTVNLPSSKELDKIFNHIFEINTVTNTFNPNKRLDFEYLADEESQLQGYLKLNEIVKNDNNKVSYNCLLVGRNVDLFSLIGEKELTDLTGLDTYNHEWTRDLQRLSWDTSIRIDGVDEPFQFGQGYVYPLIEYGLDDFTNPPTWNTEHLFPAIYVKEYIDRIFSDAGKSYSSNFFNSATFKRLIIPFNGTDIFLTDQQVEDRSLKVDTVTKTLTSSFSAVDFTNTVLDNDTNYVSGVFTVPQRGYYDLSTVVDFRAQYTPTGNPGNVFINEVVKCRLAIFKNGGAIAINALWLGDEDQAIAPAATYDTGTNVAYPSDAHYASRYIPGTGVILQDQLNYNDPASNKRLSLNEVLLDAGDTIEVRATFDLEPITNSLGAFHDGAGTSYNGTQTVTIESGKFIIGVSKATVAENGAIDIYSVIPKDVKQKDFLKSIMNMFRIEIMPDKDDPNNYIMEPYKDFLSNTAVDWQEKLDVSQDLIIEPMGLLEASEYLFKYKDDKDYFNDNYLAEYNETYGQRSGLIDNDFVKQLHTTELIFSPTPSVQVPGVDLVLPTIIKNEETYKQTESNIRILYYGGLQSTSTVWQIYSQASQNGESFTSYPFAGHFNDPYSPSIDINFGLTKRLYYNSEFSDIVVSNNNLFNTYHLPFLKQVSQRDSKLVSGWFYLKPADIATLDFRLLYFFESSYFRLYKVENYDPNKPVTKVYFLKEMYATPFEEINEWANGGDKEIGEEDDEGINTIEQLPNVKGRPRTGLNYGKKTHVISGNDNYVDDRAFNIKIQGDDNYIGSDVRNVNLLNSNNNDVIDGATNVTLINTDGLTITESDVNYIDGKKVSVNNIISKSVEKKTAEFTQEETVIGYEVVTTSGNVKAKLDPTIGQEGQIWYFKKIGASNQMIIEPQSGALIDGATSKTVTTDNETVTVLFEGSDYLVID